MQDSHVEEKQFHQKAIERLRTAYDRLQRRIEAAYEDKLDGRISADFYDQKVSEWRSEQARIREATADHEAADQSYLEEGEALLELASRAADLFEKQLPDKDSNLGQSG